MRMSSDQFDEYQKDHPDFELGPYGGRKNLWIDKESNNERRQKRGEELDMRISKRAK